MSGYVFFTDIPAAGNKFVHDTRLVASSGPIKFQLPATSLPAAVVKAEHSSISSGDLNENISCPGCWDQFSRDGKMPKVLDCSHPVCAKCIQTYMSKKNGKSGRKYPCPLCEKVTSIPKGGPRDMQTHRVTLEQVDVVRARKKQAQQAPAADQPTTSSSAAAPSTIASLPTTTASSLENNTFYQIGRDSETVGSTDMQVTQPQAVLAEPSFRGTTRTFEEPNDDNITSNAFYQMGASEAEAETNIPQRSGVALYRPLPPASSLRTQQEIIPPYREKEPLMPNYQERDLPPPYQPIASPAVFAPDQLYPAHQLPLVQLADTVPSRPSTIALTDPSNPHVVTSGGMSYWRMFPEETPASSNKGGEGSGLPRSALRNSQLPIELVNISSGGSSSNSNPNLTFVAPNEDNVQSATSPLQRRNTLPQRQSPVTEEALPLPPGKLPNPSLTGLSFTAGFGSYSEVKMKTGKFRLPSRINVSETDDILVVDEQYMAIHLFNAKFEPQSVIQMSGVQDACFFGLDKIVAATTQGVQVVYLNGRLLRDLAIGTTTAVSAYNLGFLVCQPQKLIVYTQVITASKEINSAKSGKLIKSSRKFKSLKDVAVSKDNKYIAILDAGSQEIFLLDGNNFLLLVLIKPEQQLCGSFNNPTSVAINHQGQIFLVDMNNGRILQFNSDGTYVKSPLTFSAADLAGSGPILPRGVCFQHPDLLLITLAGENFAQARMYRILPNDN